MKLQTLYLYAILFLAVSCTSDYNPMFTGSGLSGWKTVGTDNWSISGGVLTCESGKGDSDGYLISAEDYDNFELAFDFLPLELENDIGVFFHSKINSDEPFGWKIVINKSGTGGIYEQNGRGWLEHISEQNEKILKNKAWNKMKIKVEGGHVTTWLNSYLMVDYSDSKIAKGKGGIAFQIEKGGGVKVKLRNVMIKRLDEQEKVNQYF